MNNRESGEEDIVDAEFEDLPKEEREEAKELITQMEEQMERLSSAHEELIAQTQTLETRGYGSEMTQNMRESIIMICGIIGAILALWATIGASFPAAFAAFLAGGYGTGYFTSKILGGIEQVPANLDIAMKNLEHAERVEAQTLDSHRTNTGLDSAYHAATARARAAVELMGGDPHTGNESTLRDRVQRNRAALDAIARYHGVDEEINRKYRN